MSEELKAPQHYVRRNAMFGEFSFRNLYPGEEPIPLVEWDDYTALAAKLEAAEKELDEAENAACGGRLADCKNTLRASARRRALEQR